MHRPAPLSMKEAANEHRFLGVLQELLAIPATDMHTALSHAADALAKATRSDKVDTFVYDESRDSLVAVGVSAQPLSQKQRALGLDVLPVSNGGRVVHVFKTGETFRHGDVQNDDGELLGVKEGLKIQSKLGVPLDVGSERRGMIMLASLARDFFTDLDAAFLSSAARWVGLVAAHAELIADLERNAVTEAREASAQETIAVLAHDLRNYLAPVTMRLYGLHARLAAAARNEDVSDVDAALKGLHDLGALVGDLLDASRLDAGAFAVSLTPVDITALVRDAAATLATADHAVIVEGPSPIAVDADGVRMRQCIANVVSNAIDHSPAHAPVNVFVSSERANGRSWARIEVVDEGPGVPESVMPRLFERFTSGRTERGGIGLGLYIAKRIASAHGGDVAADRYPGKGARFTIRIPAIDTPNGS